MELLSDKMTLQLINNENYELPFGTIYFVPGLDTPEINEFVIRNQQRIEDKINQSKYNWLQATLVCLEPINAIAPQYNYAKLYTAIIPPSQYTDKGYALIHRSLFNTKEKDIMYDIDLFFSVAQWACEDVLDDDNFGRAKSDIFDPYAPPPAHTPWIEENIAFSIAPPKKEPHTALSHLKITRYSAPLQLTDYQDEQLRFGPQVKALYVLFLKHPEGIRMAEIANYKNEYRDLYLLYTNRSDIDKLRRSVERLLDALNPNALNVKKSQCNYTIEHTIPEPEINQYYLIQAYRNEEHKILLDRKLVLFE